MGQRLYLNNSQSNVPTRQSLYLQVNLCLRNLSTLDLREQALEILFVPYFSSSALHESSKLRKVSPQNLFPLSLELPQQEVL